MAISSLDQYPDRTRIPLSVLIVEDSEDDRMLLELELSRGAWDVTCERVDTAPAMVAALEAQSWDIIISDYSMPHFSGIASLAIARDRAGDVPFILVSGTMGEEIAVQAMKIGANDYLYKGNLKRLAPAVERELNEAQSRRESRRIEQELQKRDTQLAQAQSLARLGSWLLDASTGAMIWSDETYRILGFAPELGAKDLDAFIACFHPEDRARFAAALNAPDSARFIDDDFRIRRPDAGDRFVHISGDVTRDADGKPIEAAGSIQDITERKLAEEDLRTTHDALAAAKEAADRARDAAEAANRAKDQFLAVLSHELRTPLTPVLLTVSLLESRGDLPEIADDLSTIRRNVELEARLIDDLLDTTRIAQGKLQLNMEVIDAHLLIRSAVDVCCPDRVRDITLTLDARRHHVRADVGRFQQILWNLLNNANKFTPLGKTIHIRSGNPGSSRLRIQFADQGIGIDPAALPHIFKAFEQGDTSLTRSFGGLGLGLTICKALIEAHGGTLIADSAGKDRGATFTIEIDTVAPPVARPIRRPPPKESSAGGLRILLVEDHPGTRALMTRLLKGCGHQVKSASTIKDALDLFEGDETDLIVSDLGLPDGTGHDLMRELRTKSAVKGIAISGFGMDDDVRRSMEAGFDRHLIKPIDLEKLQVAIQQVMV